MTRISRLARRRVFLVVGFLPVLATGCASTGATLGSGVGDRLLTHPPYYAGARLDPAVDRQIPTGHLPIVYQAGASHPAIFDPSHSPAMAELLDALNARLDALGASRRLVEGGRISAVPHGTTGVPPDVQFNCVTESGVADDDCAIDPDTALGRGGQTMRLAVGRPSPEWIARTASLMDDAGVERTLVLTLEVGQYLVRQRGLAGRKEIELGTDHVVSFRWLTSLETPVSVVQLTGALVGRDGKAIRIGAEGLLAKRTRMTVSSIGGQELLTDEDVAELLSARREDLPGAPLAWEVGLRTLVERLAGPRT